jgi:hypothetical protein
MRRATLLVAMGFVACATYRPSGDEAIEELTGVRTMNSTECVDAGDCVKAALSGAKADCERGRMGFEYVSHLTRNTYLNGRLGSVTYRCIKPSEIGTGSPEFIREPAPEVTSPDGGVGRCTATEVNEMRGANLSASAIERACTP